MELDKVKFVKDILAKKFKNNQRTCAKSISICPSYLNKLVNTNAKVGIKFLSGFKSYCKSNNINFDDYIFLS